MSDSSVKEEEDISVIYEATEEISSEEPSMSEWSSLELTRIVQGENQKKLLYDQGLYSPGSGDICPKYIRQSDSSVLRHPYYNYPPVHDPGIEKALLSTELPVVYPDDGQAMYLNLCSQVNQAPVRMFHRCLLTSEINLSYYGVNPTGVRAMAIAMRFNKTVRVLNLTDNFLTDDSCFHLGDMLKANTTLQELNLSGCRIAGSGLINLGSNLNVNRTLKILNLARNQIGDEGGVHIAKLICDGLSVKNINISKNELGRLTAIAFIETFDWCDPFTVLDLSWNSFVQVPSTAKMLSQIALSQKLEEINLSFNSLEGTRVAGAICELFSIPKIQVLDLSFNRLQGEALNIITSGLIKAKRIVTLNLSFNPLSPEDAYSTLEKMLRPRVKLQNLLMESISVDKSFLTLAEKVSKMKSRKNFKLVYGTVLRNWTIKGPDPREVILKRAEFLSRANKKNSVDILVYFLTLYETNREPIPIKTLMDILSADNVPLNADYVNRLGEVFPGPVIKKERSINFSAVCEFINRLWPDKKPIEPEPEIEPPPPPPPPSKGKKDDKKKKK